MSDIPTAAPAQVASPWSFGLRLDGPDTLKHPTAITFTRHRHEGDTAFDVHSYDGQEGSIVTVHHPDGSTRMRVETVQVALEDTSVTVTLAALPDEDQAPGAEIPDREALVHNDPDLAARIRDGIAQADAGQTVHRGSFAHHLADDNCLEPSEPAPGAHATCGHCGRHPIGFGLAQGATLCHTNTQPPTSEPADCYRLVTIYGHNADGTCCFSPATACVPAGEAQ